MPSTTSKRFGRNFADQLGDRFNIVADRGGSLSCLHVDGAMLGLEGGADGVEVEGLAVGCGDHVRLAAEGLGQACPALAEFAGSEDQDAVAGRGEIGDRGFHGAGAGTGEQEDVVLGADEDLELGEHLLEEGAELGSAVVDVGGSHGELSGRQQRRWAWRKKTGLTNHGLSLRTG